MAQAHGLESQVFIQEETAFAEDPTPGGYLLPCVSYEVTESQNEIPNPTIVPGTRNMQKPARGNIDVSGNLVVVPFAEMGLLLKWLLGSVTTTGSDPYTHTFTVNTALDSFVAELGLTDITQYFKANGCKIQNMTGAIGQEGFFEMTFGVSGAKMTRGTSPLDGSPTTLNPTFFENFDIGTLEEGGSTIAVVTGITGLTVENGLTDSRVIDTTNPGIKKAIYPQLISVSGTINMVLEDATYIDKAINATETSLKLQWTLGDGLGSAGNESLQIYIPEMRYARTTPTFTGGDPLFVDLNFTAYHDDHADNSEIQFILKNSTATY